MLGLKKVREVKVRYANNIMMEPKPIYGVATIELKGRSTNLDVLVMVIYDLQIQIFEFFLSGNEIYHSYTDTQIFV
ncbi:MAG: hypothetical protein N2V78_01390 [Methanophagales archaeon]|nr:hypothetical protein [Methanophagales archaeon]